MRTSDQEINTWYSENENNSNDEISSDDTIIDDDSSYDRVENTQNVSTGDFFCEINRMHRKIKSDHHAAIKKLMTSDLSEIIDDAGLNQQLANYREDGNWHKRVFKQQRISVKTGPVYVSNAVRKKELESAYNSIESIRIQAVIKLNKHFDLMKNLRQHYFRLTKESEHLMNEINARESFAVTGTGTKISREMKFKATKLKDKLLAKDEKVKNEVHEEMETDKDMLD